MRTDGRRGGRDPPTGRAGAVSPEREDGGVHRIAPRVAFTCDRVAFERAKSCNALAALRRRFLPSDPHQTLHNKSTDCPLHRVRV